MKTKIIYISGGEVFPPSEVRAAFDTVRGMLGLDSDTVIFGVPVDADDIGAGAAKIAHVESNIVEFPAAVQEEPEQDAAEDEIAEIKPEKPARKRKKKEPVIEDAPPAEEKPQSAKPSSAPILSVIAAAKPQNTEPETEAKEDALVVEMDDEEQVQTIEDIFAGLEPLTEDKPVDLTKYDEDAKDAVSADQENGEASLRQPVDEDAALSKLATEFVASQDSGGRHARGESAKGGKIGRLKNILPFKKKEKSGTSMFGDLFGWAGVAANDDESDKFAMPDFFQMGNR